MLCCAVLCCAVLCCAVWCCAVLRCCAVLCCAVLCCAVLCCAVLCCAVLCCAVLCCAVLRCCAVQCCAVLCCAVLWTTSNEPLFCMRMVEAMKQCIVLCPGSRRHRQTTDRHAPPNPPTSKGNAILRNRSLSAHCVSSDCGTPRKSTWAFSAACSTTFGGSCPAGCATGYSGSPSVTCQASGSWSYGGSCDPGVSCMRVTTSHTTPRAICRPGMSTLPIPSFSPAQMSVVQTCQYGGTAEVGVRAGRVGVQDRESPCRALCCLP